MLNLDDSNNTPPYNIIKVYCKEWGVDSHLFVDNFLEKLFNIFKECIKENKRCVLICDCTKGVIPATTTLIKIFKYLVSIKNTIENAVNFTIFYSKDDSYKTWFDLLLKIYTPQRPIHNVSNKKDLKTLLNKECMNTVCSCSI